MATVKGTTKRVQIDKANAMMVGFVAAASFIVTFSIVASRALWSQQSYQSKVISKKEEARNQLAANIKAADSLDVSYKEFTGTSANLLGGNPEGTGDKDGDNGKLVLDALPSKYDFPALITSVEKMFSTGSYTLKSIGGNDDGLSQTDQPDANPTVVEMPFTFTAEGSFDGMKELVGVADRSIRPIKINTISLNGNDGLMTASISAVTYYQAAKDLSIRTEVVR